MVVEWIAIVISLIALGISIWIWKKPKLKENELKKSSLVTLFELLGSSEIKESKKKVAFWYWVRLDRSQPIHFIHTKYENDSYRLKQAFEMTAAMYERGLIDQEYFRQVFGGTLVRFWQILEQDILLAQKENPLICKHFQTVAMDLMNNYKIDDKPYRTRL